MCILLMKLWLICIIPLISICSFAKFKQVSKSQMKESERNVEKKKKKQLLLFKCPRCQCNALQGYKASHYSLAFVESSSSQIVTGLFLNRYWEKQAEQRTPNYPVLWGAIKLLIRELSSWALSFSLSVCVSMCIWSGFFFFFTFLSYVALNIVKCLTLLLFVNVEIKGVGFSSALRALLFILNISGYGLYGPLLVWHTCAYP